MGRLCKKNQGDIAEHTFYDNLGNITREETPYSWEEYSYDARGNKTQERTFDGVWDYQYDAIEEVYSCVHTEVLADFIVDPEIDFKVIRLDYPQPLPKEGYTIYLRKEPFEDPKDTDSR